jgi:uncharacterized PurR-regulated membrane protein YhhQ (DUF165 family)
MYLAAIIAANLTIAHFGASATAVVAFVFIAFDITVRDSLHEQWYGRGLQWKMPLLILVGAVVSFALNTAALPIAVASFVAFIAAGATDTAVYQWVHKAQWFHKVNISNVASAVVDTLVFVVLAFGFPVLWHVVLWQIVAKIAGGLGWSILLKKKGTRQWNPLGS